MKGTWTDEEVERLNSYLAEGLSVPKIASRLDRSIASVHSKIDYIRMTPEEREHKRERHRAYHRQNRSNSRNPHHENAQLVMSCRPSEEVLKERDVRYATPFRDLTGFLLGDPPIGYSALDRK